MALTLIRDGALIAVTTIILIIAAMFSVSLVIDARVRPRTATGWRSAAGLWVHGLAMIAAFGLVLALCGNPLAAAFAVLGLMAAVVLGSNTKYAVLGEPLLFSDLALVRAVFRYPQFYFTALTRNQMAALVAGALALPFSIAWLFVTAAAPHVVGLLLFGGALAVLAASVALPPWDAIARQPEAHADVARHGLVTTLIFYWLRWRDTPDPPPCTAALPAPATTELVVIIQCESFADPAELFGDPTLHLPGLSAAREAAWASGRLLVPGFGAYTMRTEYGVIFGLDEAALGFRRYDPYLTAAGQASHALPTRLAPAGWRSLFVHPHDMRFYGRDTLMPTAGFSELIGLEHFAPPAAGEGRYVPDAAITDCVLAIIAAAQGPTLIHAVTIENHGPWPLDRPATPRGVSTAYLTLVGKGDAMLARLHAGLAARSRAAVLLFYGDHRPSIPGATSPDGPRHTPFVLLRFDADGVAVRGDGCPLDLTPAQLHHKLIAGFSAA